MVSIRDKTFTHKLRPFHTKNDNHKDNYNNNYISMCLCCSYFVCCYKCLRALKSGGLYFAVIVFFCFFYQLKNKNPSENHFNDIVPLCHYCYTCDVDFKYNIFFNIAVFYCIFD